MPGYPIGLLLQLPADEPGPLSRWERVGVRVTAEIPNTLTPALSQREREEDR
jgi:hypothetical protein